MDRGQGRRVGLVVETSEEGNPRKSFDINLYKSELTMADIDPLLRGLGRHYGLPDEQWIRAAKDTGLIFVSNEKTNNIIVLDPKTYKVVKDLKVSRRPRDSTRYEYIGSRSSYMPCVAR